MDWTQASFVEIIAVALGFAFMLAFAVFGVVMLVTFAYDFMKVRVARLKRLKKTTRALRCDACIHNVCDGNFRKCEKFGYSISFAPVSCPGCSWGTERKEGGDD